MSNYLFLICYFAEFVYFRLSGFFILIHGRIRKNKLIFEIFPKFILEKKRKRECFFLNEMNGNFLTDNINFIMEKGKH